MTEAFNCLAPAGVPVVVGSQRGRDRRGIMFREMDVRTARGRCRLPR